MVGVDVDMDVNALMNLCEQLEIECSNAQELADALVDARKEILNLRDQFKRADHRWMALGAQYEREITNLKHDLERALENHNADLNP